MAPHLGPNDSLLILTVDKNTIYGIGIKKGEDINLGSYFKSKNDRKELKK